MKDGLYNVATLTDQKGVGATVGSGSQKVEAELRLANRYEKFTFNVGQANNSKSSDETLHVEVNKNGANDSIIEVPFNETRPANLELFTELGIRNAWYVFSVQHGYHLHG